ncbi:autotransporter outer membrane beta-barrel domain-containing protein [Mesorhizobium sp. M1406]|uniref:autotransporter outer membrane beta-barrel domain-containing protein n=1 Tax=Mesorhizobium sp. M1406 TaxID=2957099 RepID=UPI0033390CB6
MSRNVFGGRKATPTLTVPGRYLNPLRNPRHMAGVSSLALMLGSAGLVGMATSAAADATWTGATSTNWFDPGNWTPNAVPDATNFVNINTLTPNPTVISGAAASGLVVFVGRNAGDVASLKIINGGTLSDSQGPVARFAGSTGTVVVDGPGSAWLHSDDFYVAAEGKGMVTILNGGVISDVRGILGDADTAVAVLSVDGKDSIWTNSSTLAVGRFGTGILNVSNQGTVTSTDGYIGRGTASNGYVTIDGAGSTWANSGSLTVGDSGTGALAITKGGAVSNAAGYVGKSAGSTGMVFVDGGSTWTNSSNLLVGDFGTGTLAITHGGAVSNSWAAIGAKAGSTGMVFVDGTGSTWTNSSNLAVGDFGAGTLTITNGGAVSNDWGYVGNSAGSTGMVAVDGAGSKWTNSGNLYVGGLSTGTLTISNGGAVSSDDLFVGYQGTGALNIVNGGKLTNQAASLGEVDTATATATVDGPGSSWSTDDVLAVGAGGHATLSITNGGSADADAVVVGGATTAAGAVTVDGAGSKWTNKNGLYLGDQGSGTLTVTNGGVASGGFAYMGIGADATGQATVDGTDSLWEMHGDLLIGFDGTASVTLSNGGTAIVDGLTVIASQAGSTGNLNIGGAAGSAATGAGIFDPAALQFGAGTGALNFNHTGANYAFGAIIGGLGTINQIAGNTNLTADSSGFTGATNVSGGRLAVNGSLANSLVTVSGGTLGGNGTVGGIVAQAGGIIAPGNSIGTLNVAGDIDHAAGSIYQIELTSTGTSDFLHATGAATIDSGALIDVVKLDGAPYVAGTHYTVLQADSGVTGTYTVTGDTGAAFLGLVDSYDANHVYLDVVQKTFASVGLTPNQIATGGGAEGLGSGNALYDAIMQLPTEAAAQDAFDQLSGEIHASAKGMLVEDSRFVRDAASNRISAAFGDAGAAALPVMAYGEGGPEMVSADTDRFAVWGQAFGSWGNTDSDGNAAAFDRSTGGLLAGADTLVGGWRVGLLGGYSHSSFDADDRNSSGKSDNYHLGLYGGTNWGAIAFRTGAAYSWSSLSTKRAVAFNGFTDALSADYDAGTAQVFGELAYKADAGRFKLEPFANLAYVSVHTDGFTETGGAAALTSAGSTTDATFTTLGLRGSTDLALGGMNATARGMLGWRHAFGDTTPLSTLAFAGGDAFTIAGVPVARDAALVEAGVDLHLAANATLGLSYSGQFGGGGIDQGAKVDLGIRF